MIEYLLVAIIIVLLAFILYKDREHGKQINKLIGAIIAKNAGELASIKLSEATKIEHNSLPLTPEQNDFIPVGTAEGDLFDKAIKQQLEEQDKEPDFF